MKNFIPVLLLICSIGVLSCSSIDDELKQVANNYNDKAPFMINETTRFDSMSILPGRVMQYNLTMTNLKKEETDIHHFEEQIPVLSAQIKATIPQTIKDHNVGFAYSYSDKEGVFVHKITITPEMYK